MDFKLFNEKADVKKEETNMKEDIKKEEVNVNEDVKKEEVNANEGKNNNQQENTKEEKKEEQKQEKSQEQKQENVIKPPYVVVIVDKAKLYKRMNFNGEFIEAKKGEKYPVVNRYRVEGRDENYYPIVKYMWKTKDGFFIWEKEVEYVQK